MLLQHLPEYSSDRLLLRLRQRRYHCREFLPGHIRVRRDRVLPYVMKPESPLLSCFAKIEWAEAEINDLEKKISDLLRGRRADRTKLFNREPSHFS